MTAVSTSPQNSRFTHSTHVAISHLEPPSDADEPHHITAVVALVWPYSSSTRALSLLLAEPDIRLRKGKGQVKVTFCGPSAEAVANGHVGIGDTVKLGLEGAQWIQSGENVSTPGKKIEWDLAFDGKANLDVKRDSQILASIQVNRPVQVPAAVSQPWSRPVDTFLNGHGSTRYIRDSYSWSSPAFVKGKRLSSGSFFDASLDPFVDDDGFIVGRGRKRSKFARHSDSWRLLERTPSPEIDTFEEQLDDINGLAETAASTTPQQTIPNAVETEIPDVVPLGPKQLESTTGPRPTESDENHVPSPLQESQSNEIGPTTLDAVHSPQAVSQQAVKGHPLDKSPPDSPVQRPASLSGMTADSVAGMNAEFSARSDLETTPLEPDRLSGLPSLSPSIRHSGVSTDYLPDWSSRSEAGVVVDHQQSVTTSQAIIAPGPTAASSSDVGVQSHPLPVELELPVDNAWFDTGQPLPEVSPQFDQPFLPMQWPSSYEDVSQPDIVQFEQAQTPTYGKGSDFEFLNTSPVEPSNDAQHTWSHLGLSSETMATLQAPVEADRPEPTEALVPPSELAREVLWEIPPHNDPNSGSRDEVTTSDPAGAHVGGAAQDKNVNAEPELATDSLQQLPIDPSLVSDLEQVARLVTNSQDHAEATSEAPEQNFDSRQWSDKLDVSAVDAESQHVYLPPPFPFQQRWHRRPSSQRSRRSSQYPSLDGASNELSADESVDSEDMSDSFRRPGTIDHENRDYGGDVTNDEIGTPPPALSPLSELASRPQDTEVRGKGEGIPGFQALDEPQSVVAVDSSDEDTTPGDLPLKTVKDAIPDAALSPADQPQDLKPGEVDDPGIGTGMGVSESQETATDRNEGPRIQSGSPYEETSSPAVDVLAAEYKEGPSIQAASAHEETSSPAVVVTAAEEKCSAVVTSPSRRHDLAEESSGPSTEPTTLSELPDKLLDPMSHFLLFTPENTQQEQSDSVIHDQTAELGQEMSLPPTPQNTQEYPGVPQQTVELPMERAPEVEESNTPKSAFPVGADESSEQRKSPRLSRKIPPPEKVVEVVVPRVTPRRRSQSIPTVQLTAPNKLTIRTDNEARVDDATQMTAKDNKLMESSSTQEDVAPKRQHTAHPNAGLTTSFSYYTLLSLLPDQFTQSVDVLALSTTASAEPQKAKSGPRDWHMTLHLTDPSLQGNKTITAQIFRPYKTALPKVQRGHVVLLRNFKVQSQKRKCMLLSTDASAWTVFAVHENSGHEICKCDAVTVGPPVEYGSEEMGYATELKKWWVAEGEGQHPVEKHASRASRHTPVADNGDTAELTHVLRDGTTYKDPTRGGDEGADPEAYHELRDGTVYQGPPLTKKSDPDLEKGEANNDEPAVLHELRDGTIYVDPPIAKKSIPDQEIGEADAEVRKTPILHELRDGTLYQTDPPTLNPREQKRSRSSTATKTPLPIGDTVVIESNASSDKIDETNNQTNQEPTSTAFDPNDDLESGEKSPTNEAVSSQIYHELRNGRRYFDPIPAQMRFGEAPEEEENEGESVIHELRDGVTYIDE